jgi:hypothetical protein
VLCMWYERDIGPFGCFVRKKGTLKVVLLCAEMLVILHTDTASFKKTISANQRFLPDNRQSIP